MKTAEQPVGNGSLSNQAELLVFLMRKGSTVCPEASFTDEGWNILFDLAARNKVVYALFHFLTCKSIRHVQPEGFTRRLAAYKESHRMSYLARMRERRVVSGRFHRLHIKAAILKDLCSGGIYPDDVSPYVGNDTDVMIRPEDAPRASRCFQGYRQHAFPPKEVSFVHPRTFAAFDLHTIIAYPHHGGMRSEKEAVLRRFSTAYITASRKSPDGFLVPPREYLMLSLVIRFFENDLLRGLRNLQDIALVASKETSGTFWKRYYRLAGEFGYVRKTRFLILSAAGMFGLDTPETMVRLYPKLRPVRYLLPVITPESVAVYPPLNQWNGVYRTWADAELAKVMILDKLLSDDVKSSDYMGMRTARLLLLAGTRMLAGKLAGLPVLHAVKQGASGKLL